MENVLQAPTIAEPLGLFDCCGVSRRLGLRHGDARPRSPGALARRT